jgi:CheY-like chemotaxis protein
LYGFPSRIATVSQAVSIVGMNQLHDLAVGASFIRLFGNVPQELTDMTSFWQHSVAAVLPVAGAVIAAADDRTFCPAPGPAVERRVLVAEDNGVNQIVAGAMLRRLGCTVDLASDGAEVLRLLEQGTYDLIFMDCMMPGLDGYAATAEIRRREGVNGHIPIVAMTANAMEDDRTRCLAAGMDDYLSKPVHRDALARMLDRWVPQRAEA